MPVTYIHTCATGMYKGNMRTCIHNHTHRLLSEITQLDYSAITLSRMRARTSIERVRVGTRRARTHTHTPHMHARMHTHARVCVRVRAEINFCLDV